MVGYAPSAARQLATLGLRISRSNRGPRFQRRNEDAYRIPGTGASGRDDPEQISGVEALRTRRGGPADS